MRSWPRWPTSVPTAASATRSARCPSRPRTGCWSPWSARATSSGGSRSPRWSASAARRASCWAWRRSSAPPSVTASSRRHRRQLPPGPHGLPRRGRALGTRMSDAGAFEAFKVLTDIVPRPGHKASGEERAWGRRLAKRFGIEADALRRPELHHHRRRRPAAGVRPRVAQAREDRRRGRRAQFDRPRPGPGRLPGRLRLGHGRGTAEARVTGTAGGRRARPLRRGRWRARGACAATSWPTAVDPAALDTVLPMPPSGPRPPATPGRSTWWCSRAPTRPRYWDVTLPERRRAGFPLARPAAGPGAGRPRRGPRRLRGAATARPTRPRTGLGDGAEAWPVPYWFVDGGAAVMALLLAAEAARAGGAVLRPVRPRARRARRPRGARRPPGARHDRPRPPRARGPHPRRRRPGRAGPTAVDRCTGATW